MKELTLTADQAALVEGAVAASASDEILMAMPLAEAKRRVANDFERRYLVRLMERAGGSISEGARIAGLDRTNFRRLLQRHDLR